MPQMKPAMWLMILISTIFMVFTMTVYLHFNLYLLKICKKEFEMNKELIKWEWKF